MMHDGPTPSAGARRAALTLHAMGEADRAWLLQQLGSSQRGTLAALLEELEALGIPRDEALVREAISSASLSAHPMQPGFDAGAFCEALAREPQRAWKDIWLSFMDEVEREAILAHWPRPLEPRPRAARSLQTNQALREAVRASWLEAAQGVGP